MQLNILCQNDIEYEGSFWQQTHIFHIFRSLCHHSKLFVWTYMYVLPITILWSRVYLNTDISNKHHPLGNPQLVTPHNPTPMLKSFMVFSFIVYSGTTTLPKWLVSLFVIVILLSSTSSACPHAPMPREVSDFHKPIKPTIGGSFSHDWPGGHWDKPGTTATGKVIGWKRQTEWQDSINSSSHILLSGECSLFQ